MRRMNGRIAVNDDEWYTPRETADKVAAWLVQHLELDTPMLCPADLLPDGSESTIPQALRAAGFTRVRVTRDLPINPLLADYRAGEVIVTNPPFSLLVKFRQWAMGSGALFCVLSCPATMRNCWTIPSMGSNFKSACGRTVAAAWMQNIADTTNNECDTSTAIGNCRNCERARCPNNQMTGEFPPLGERPDRPLYGWGSAVLRGIGGFCCNKYTIGGREAFVRFFYPSSAD